MHGESALTTARAVERGRCTLDRRPSSLGERGRPSWTLSAPEFPSPAMPPRAVRRSCSEQRWFSVAHHLEFPSWARHRSPSRELTTMSCSRVKTTWLHAPGWYSPRPVRSCAFDPIRVGRVLVGWHAVLSRVLLLGSDAVGLFGQSERHRLWTRAGLGGPRGGRRGCGRNR
jgi:hypothetical protein